MCFQGNSHIHTHFYITIKNVDANTPEICMNHLGDNLFIQKNIFTTKCEQSTPLQDCLKIYIYINKKQTKKQQLTNHTVVVN